MYPVCKIEHMNETRILVALRLRSYRETIAEVIRMTVPGAEVVVLEPENLDQEVSLLHPALVICSRITPAVEDEAPFWVEMYRDHGPLSTIKTPDRRWEIEGLELSDLTGMLTLL